MAIDFEKELNAEQLAAVRAGDGPLLVLAAAGTGKTRTLVFRVAYLMEQGIAPDRILLLTFTNRSAREMLDRAVALAGVEVGGLWGGTFHHMSNRMLRRHAPLVGLPHDYTILDREDTESLVAECIKQKGFARSEFPKKGVLLEVFAHAINSRRPLEDVARQRFSELAVAPEDIVAVHRAFVARKRELRALDFDDLLVEAARLLAEHPDVLGHYQRQFIHILVDEYQDTNPIQSELVDRLGAGHGNVLVVGDDFQSIYSWRGADCRNILGFPDRYPTASVVKLETNYRSTPDILAVANACIRGNPKQFQKVLRATRPAHCKPRVVYLRTGDQQAEYVAREIGRLRAAGLRCADIAVLYRAHFHCMELQMYLARAHVPFVVTSGVRFFEQAHIKDVCSLLRIMTMPEDELAFNRVVGLLHGAGPRTVEKAWQALDRRFDAGAAAQRAVLRRQFKAQTLADFDRLEPVFAAHGGHTPDAGTVIDDFVHRFYGRYVEAAFENGDRRLEDVEEMALFTAKYPTTEEFLAEVALMTNLDAESETLGRRGAETDAVRLSTVHQAKGLEWRAVIVLWLTDGMFPSSRALSESPEAEEEERRLFYVTVTRAKDELCLCVPELRFMRDGGVFPCKPSRFIEEIDAGLVREMRPSGYG